MGDLQMSNMTIKSSVKNYEVIFVEDRNLLMADYSKKDVIIVGDFNSIQIDIDSYDFKKHYNKLAGVTEIEIKNFKTLSRKMCCHPNHK